MFFTVDQLAKFKIYASNDPTSFNSPVNLCHVSTRDGSGRGNWINMQKNIYVQIYFHPS